MRNKREIGTALKKLLENKDFASLYRQKEDKKRRAFRDAIIYRLMWDKALHDDTVTDYFMSKLDEKSL